MKAEKEIRGLAFWRAKDRWALGLTAEADIWRFRIGLPSLDFDGAKGFHFDRLCLSWAIGPFYFEAYCRDAWN